MKKSELTSIFGICEPAIPRELSTEAGAAVAAMGKQHKLDAKTIAKLKELVAEPQIRILSDQPAEVDSLRQGAFVRTLSDIALSETTQTPLTIALDGEWGTGKTSVMRMVEQQARMLDYSCLRLNAWSLESSESLLIETAKEVEQEIKRIGKRPVSKKNIQNFLNGALSAIGSTLAGGLLSVVGESTKLGVEATRRIRQHEDTLERITSLAMARHSFQRLIEPLLKRKERQLRLIVFVDDVDRALPDQIADILKRLKLILESPGCVFILGMDLGIVARSIEDHYHGTSMQRSFREGSSRAGSAGEPHSSSGFGYAYLQKLIQIHLRLPHLNWSAVEEYLAGIGVAQEAIEIVRWAPTEKVFNPRRLKRYVNELGITLQLIMASDLPSEFDNLTALRTMALRRDHPELYAQLSDPSRRESAWKGYLAKAAAHDESEIGRVNDYVKSFPLESLMQFEEFLRTSPLLRGCYGEKLSG